MAASETPAPRKLGATVLLGKGLTPGKLRGLQRISNPNGTLTMLALDQNSSMIEMANKALKGKGIDREPSYEEIVEAKLDMMRQMAPAASGVLIDAYYGAYPAIASGACPPAKGMLVRVEKSGSPKNAVGGPMGEFEPGWSVEYARLAALGITNVHGNDGSAGWCSVSNPSRFFSHRRDRISGRFAAGVWLA